MLSVRYPEIPRGCGGSPAPGFPSQSHSVVREHESDHVDEIERSVESEGAAVVPAEPGRSSGLQSYTSQKGVSREGVCARGTRHRSRVSRKGGPTTSQGRGSLLLDEIERSVGPEGEGSQASMSLGSQAGERTVLV